MPRKGQGEINNPVLTRTRTPKLLASLKVNVMNVMKHYCYEKSENAFPATNRRCCFTLPLCFLSLSAAGAPTIPTAYESG